MRGEIKNLKHEARCALDLRHASLAGITVLITVLNLALSMLSSMAMPSGNGSFVLILYFAISILVNVIYYILLAGLYRIYLNLSRALPYRWRDLFSEFNVNPEPVAIFSVIQFLLTFLFEEFCGWYIAEIIAFAFYKESVSIPMDTVVLIAALALYLWLRISLSMALFIHVDQPELKWRQLISESWKLMKGERGEFFYLELSFIGMYALAVCSFGIGLVFVQPYFYTTQALFYRRISGQ